MQHARLGFSARVAVLLAAALPLAAQSAGRNSNPGTFIPASSGCWMAHCDPQLDDASGVPSTLSGFHEVSHQNSGASGGALGCSGNGSVFACVYGAFGSYAGPYLYSFNLNGNTLWNSGTTLDGKTYFCLPMIGSDSGVISCDDTQAVRWDSGGTVLWDTCFYAGTAPACTCPDGVSFPPCSLTAGQNYTTSPVLLANGSIVMATSGTSGHGGPVFNVNSATGAIIGSPLYMGQSGSDSYITFNTPCASPPSGPDSGNRVFIITNNSADSSQARMYALTAGSSGLSVAWVYPSAGNFTGPSGASPLCASGGSVDGVYADATDSTGASKGAVWGWNQSTGAVLFACDDGTAGTGCPAPPGHLYANFALDPRAGTPSFWMWYGGANFFERRSTATGNVEQKLKISVPGDSCPLTPTAAMTMTTDAAGNPAMISGVRAVKSCTGGAYVVQIDAINNVLQGYYEIEPTAESSPGPTYSQFPLGATPDGQTHIAFSVAGSGIYVIGSN